MYNYGMDGDDTFLHGPQLSPHNNMVGQPVDDNESVITPRGEEYTPFVKSLTSHLLRIGFFIQAISLFFMLVFYTAFGGTGIFIFDIYAAPDNVKISRSFHLVISIITGFYLIGILYLAFFQVFVSDNSKLCRGFRTGSKMFSAAITLDVICTSLRLVQYLYAYFFLNMRWWSRYQQTKADWLLFNCGNVLNAFALCLYGGALFYMEAYHDEGVGEEYAWANLFLFQFAALSELLMVFTGYGAFFSLFILGATICAAFWANAFEPLLQKYSPELHSRDINAYIMPNEDDQTIKMNDINVQRYHNDESDSNDMRRKRILLSSNGDPTANALCSTLNQVDIPTSYDYSQMQEQISRDMEMGVISNHYDS